MASQEVDPVVAGLLEEAVELRLIGLMFEYPSLNWRSNLESLVPCLHRQQLRGMAEAALQEASEGLHIALFGPAGTVPVREVTYQGGVQFGYLMAELASYYEAFDFTPADGEPADHLAVQIGFLAYLKLKQAHAVSEQDTENAALVEEAARNFTRDHLAVQAEPVVNRLTQFAPSFLCEAGNLLLSRTGRSARSDYPLTCDFIQNEQEEISCGPALSDDSLIQLQPQEIQRDR